MEPVALIAGEGQMPLKTLEGIKNVGKRVLVIGLKGMTSPDIIEKADIITWGYVTQLGKAIRICKKYGVKEIIMAGRVQHSKMFSVSLWHMDWTTLRAWFKKKDGRADALLNAIANIFEEKGITLGDSIQYLKKQVADKGILTKTQPHRKLKEDVEFGYIIAKEIGRLDIGQTVVIKNKSIVAIEAMEGTDQCLERAGEVAGNGCVVIKVAKPNQDMRFDVPTIGVNTIEKLAKIGAPVLAIEAGKTILIDDDTVEAANRLGICIISL